MEVLSKKVIVNTPIRNVTLENCHCSPIYLVINHNLTQSVFVIKLYFVEFR